VPCIVRWPGKVPAGKVSNEIVHTVDWFTTLAHAAGAQVSGDRIIDGMDMRGFTLGDAEESGRAAVLCMQGNRLQASLTRLGITDEPRRRRSSRRSRGQRYSERAGASAHQPGRRPHNLGE
jgi:arylsulfatase A-like enzyme